MLRISLYFLLTISIISADKRKNNIFNINQEIEDMSFRAMNFDFDKDFENINALIEQCNHIDYLSGESTLLSLKCQMAVSFGREELIFEWNQSYKEKIKEAIGYGMADRELYFKILSMQLEVIIDGFEYQRENVENYNIIDQYRETRSRIGLVPQELTLEAFETVFNNVSYSRGLYGKKPDPKHIEKILKDLSLWDKKDLRLRQLSGGMKRRVLIAKALSHEPSILFLDEPTAGVDVELRRHLWEMVQELNKKGTTILLTTHYIEEAEKLCDRIGILNEGDLVACDTKDKLLGLIDKKELIVKFQDQFTSLPKSLNELNPIILDNKTIKFIYQPSSSNFQSILDKINSCKLNIIDLEINETDLEEVFLSITQKNILLNL